MDLEKSYFNKLANKVTMGKFFDDYFAGVATAIIGWLLSFMAPIWPFAVFAMAATLVDSMLGVRVAKRKKEDILIRGYVRPVEKMLIYLAILMMCEGANIVFLKQQGIEITTPFVYIVGLAIGRAEMRSIFKHAKILTGVDFGTEISKQLKNLIHKK